MSDIPVCLECGWEIDRYTHHNHCPIGIVESDDAIEKVRYLMKKNDYLMKKNDELRKQRDEVISKY